MLGVPDCGLNCGRSEAGREAGFTMIMFVLILVLMAIMMTVAVQTVTFAMQREREAELIFRGQQYVLAIGQFKKRHGRYPMALKELWEADPRVIRKKYKDPITDSYSWGVIFQGQERRIRPPQGNMGLPSSQPTTTPVPDPRDRGTGGTALGRPGGPGESAFGQPAKRGPIVGVHSTSCENSIKVLENRTRYCDWRFIYEEKPKRPRTSHPPQQPGNRKTPTGNRTPRPTGTPKH